MTQEGKQDYSPQKQDPIKQEKIALITLPNGEEIKSRGNRARFLQSLSNGQPISEHELRKEMFGNENSGRKIGADIHTLNDTLLYESAWYIGTQVIETKDGSRMRIFQLLPKEDPPSPEPATKNPYSEIVQQLKTTLKQTLETEKPIQKPDFPSEDNIPLKYLIALEKYLENPELREEIGKDVEENISISNIRSARFNLQTTLNYLALRVNEGRADTHEQRVWERALEISGETVTKNALQTLKEDIRRNFLLPHDYSPKEEDGFTKTDFTSQEIIQLAKTLDTSTLQLPRSVQEKISSIMESSLSNHIHQKIPNTDARIHALSFFIDVLGNSDNLNFIESHSGPIREILYYLENNRPFLFISYLKQIKIHQVFVRQNELQEKAKKLFFDTRFDATPFIKYAKEVENELQYTEDREKVFILFDDFIKSEMAANQSLEKTETLTKENQRNADTKNSGEKRKLNAYEEKIQESIKSILEKYFSKWEKQPIAQFNPIQLATFFRLTPNQVNHAYENRFVNPAKKTPSSKDYHPWFTVDEALMAVVVAKLKGVRHDLLIELGLPIIHNMLEGWKKNNPKSTNGK